MSTKVINVSDYEQELNLLERIHFEVKARENILGFLFQNGDTVHYKNYWEDYIEHLKAYDIIKNQFTQNCVNKVLGYNLNGTWQVKFDTKEVIINELD